MWIIFHKNGKKFKYEFLFKSRYAAEIVAKDLLLKNNADGYEIIGG